MKSTIIRFVIIILILAVIIAAVLLYVGGERFVIVEHATKESLRPEGGYKVSMQAMVMTAIASVMATIGIWTLIKFLIDLPARLRSGVSSRKRGQALEAMEDALIAASAGDADKARKKAARARTLIDRPALGQIMSAQAAEVSGDSAEAKAQYELMLDNDKTRKVAQRGLATLAYNRGDMATAVSFAQSAYADNKDAKWAFDILFGAQVADHQWAAALETLDSGERRKHIDKDISRRRRAVIQTAHASDMASEGKLDSARELATRAAGDMLRFAPGVALAAQLLVQSGDDERAAKLIEKAWAKAPHPALALAYKDLQSGETAKVRAKRMKSLMKQNSSHRESTLLGVEEALLEGNGVSAWSALAPIAKEPSPSARVCALAAKAESLCDNPVDAGLWVARAATASTEPDWSDLDPEGTAFAYSPADWRRMIFSYGDSGELIHPRHERFENTRAVTDLSAIKAGQPADKPADPAPVEPPKVVSEAPVKEAAAPTDFAKPVEPIVKAPSPDVIL